MSKQYQLKGLREQRAKIQHDIRAIGDRLRAEQRALSADEREAFDKLKTSFTTVSESIRQAEADLQALDALASQPDPEADPAADPAGDMGPDAVPADGTSAGRFNVNHRPDRRDAGRGERAAADRQARSLAFQAWARSQYGLPLSRQHRDACKRTGLDPRAKHFRHKLARRGAIPNRRDYSTTAADGGYTIPQDFSYALELALKDFSGVRQVADVFRTDTGATMPYPTGDDTGNLGEQLSEATEVAYQSTTFNTVNFGAYKYSSKGMLISHELLNDSAFDLEAILGEMGGERIGRIQNARFTTGTGSGQPQGVVTGSVKGRDAAAVAAISVDDVIRLMHSVDPAYRNGPNVGFMCNDSTLATLSLIRDGEGRPLLLPNYREGGPDLIRGKPVYPNQAMADVGASAKSLLFGDFSKYKIRDVGEVRVRRLDERWAEKDQVGFIVFLRSDGKLINTNAVKHLLHPAS